jgi:hypothetical protein
MYQADFLATPPLLAVAIPALGGAAVGLLLLLGRFPPGLLGTVAEVDKESSGDSPNVKALLRTQLSFLRKTMGAVSTIGTGCSLGPEGPSVGKLLVVSPVCFLSAYSEPTGDLPTTCTHSSHTSSVSQKSD